MSDGGSLDHAILPASAAASKRSFASFDTALLLPPERLLERLLARLLARVLARTLARLASRLPDCLVPDAADREREARGLDRPLETLDGACVELVDEVVLCRRRRSSGFADAADRIAEVPLRLARRRPPPPCNDAAASDAAACTGRSAAAADLKALARALEGPTEPAT